jgi:hypothetical protein
MNAILTAAPTLVRSNENAKLYTVGGDDDKIRCCMGIGLT